MSGSNPIPQVRDAWIPEEVPDAKQRTRSFFSRYALDRDGLVDLAFTVVVTALVLLGLRTGFIGWQWVMAAVGGALLGLLVTHIVVSHRWSVLGTLDRKSVV